MPQKRLGLEKVKLKVPFIEVEWKNRDVKDVPVHIFSKHSGKCIDVQDYSHDDGGSIVQFSLHGADNQR